MYHVYPPDLWLWFPTWLVICKLSPEFTATAFDILLIKWHWWRCCYIRNPSLLVPYAKCSGMNKKLGILWEREITSKYGTNHYLRLANAALTIKRLCILLPCISISNQRKILRNGLPFKEPLLACIAQWLQHQTHTCMAAGSSPGYSFSDNKWPWPLFQCRKSFVQNR